MASPTIGVSATAGQASGASLSTGAVTSAASGSSFFIGFVTHSGASVTSVVDSKGNTYTSVTSIVEANDGEKLWIYKCENGTGGASHTSTVTVSADCFETTFVEVVGAATSAIVEATTTKYTNGSSPFDASVTTLGVDRLVISWCFTGQAPGSTYTAGGGFTKLLEQTTHSPITFGHRAAATAAAYDPSWTNSLYSPMARVSLSIIPAASGPNITSVSTATPREGASLTITGTAFGASQGSGDVKINGVAQTVTSWSDTSIAVTIVLGTNKFGAAYTVVVRDNALTASNSYAGITGLLPANSGLSYVDIGTPNTTSAYRLTSTADLVSGDQVEYENKGSGVTVATDGTFTANAGIASFSARAWTSGSGYGASGVQLLINTGSLLMSNSHKNKRRRF